LPADPAPSAQHLYQDERKPPSRLAWLVVVYVAAVLGIDALAASGLDWPFDWGMFDWRPRDVYAFGQWAGLPKETFDWLNHVRLQGFWVFKFVFWLLAPGLVCLFTMDWQYFTFRRWKTWDYALLLAACALGAAAVFLIPLIPGLADYYPQMARQMNLADKLAAFGGYGLMLVSWLPGWEFLHRYVLVRAVHNAWPRYGWLLVPLSEGLYHLTKHWAEALGMVLFSVLATRWTIARRNMLLPFLVHLVIELTLFLFIMNLF